MGSSESARVELYNRLTEVLGPEHTVTLMTYLPEVPADQALTKGHFDDALARIDLRFGQIDGRFEQIETRFTSVDHRLDRLESAFHDQVRLFVGTTVGAMTGLTAIYAFVVSLIR